MLRLALTKLVEIVGEAAKQISDETREQHPSVPWIAASRMRDRLIHHSFDIDLDILWATVTDDLPRVLGSLGYGTVDAGIDPIPKRPSSDDRDGLAGAG